MAQPIATTALPPPWSRIDAGVVVPSILQGPDQAQNATQNRSQGAKRSFLDPSTWPAWLRFTVGYLGPPVGLALAAYLALRILKALRRSRRRTRGSAAQRVEGGWAELVDAARDLGMPLPPKATRLEQAGALDRLAEADADALAALGDEVGDVLGRGLGKCHRHDQAPCFFL